jgi:hypothetical protein
MIDILFDNIEDQGFDLSELETSNPEKMYVEQIRMAFESGIGEIMGSEDPIDLEQYVFEQNLNETEIAAKIRQGLGRFCSLYEDFKTEVEVFFSKGELRDTCLVVVTVNKQKYRVIIR